MGAATPATRRPAALEQVQTSLWQWVWQTAACMSALAAATTDERVKKALRRRALAFRLCGTRCEVLACPEAGCGAIHPRTGRVTRNAGKPCRLRCCPFCERHEAKRRAKKLLRAMGRVRQVKGWRWKMLTLTFAYDPANPWETSAEGLTARLKEILRAVRHLWGPGGTKKCRAAVERERRTRAALRTLEQHANGRNARHRERLERARARHARAEAAAAKVRGALCTFGSSLYWSVENAGHGNVHVHGVFYGAWVDQPSMVRRMREVAPRAGFTWVSAVDDARYMAREVAKYVTKCTSYAREDLLANGTGTFVNPQLAANFEAASYRTHLHQYCGELRDAAGDDDDDAGGAAGDAPMADPTEERACGVCGVCAVPVRRIVRTRDAAIECHARGDPLFANTLRELSPERFNALWVELFHASGMAEMSPAQLRALARVERDPALKRERLAARAREAGAR